MKRTPSLAERYRRVGRQGMAGAPILVLLVAFLVAGCGQSVQKGPGGSVPPTHQNCGTVTIHEAGTPTGASASAPENCFYTAYQQCHSATLTVTTMGVDAGTTRTFTTQQNGTSCVITDAVATYVVPRPPSAAKTYTCSGLARQSDGLHFASCGADGSVFVPAPAA